MPEHNYRVIKMVGERYSKQVQYFNGVPDLTDADSDRHYDLYKELDGLMRTAFGRAPEFKPSGVRVALLPSADLGNAYRVLKQNLTPQERARYEEIQTELYALTDKYEI
jgi:hypothetical protein